MARWRQRAAALGVAAMAALMASVPAADARPKVQEYEFDVVWSVFPDLVLATGALSLERRSDLYAIGMEARARLQFPRIDWRGLFAVEGDSGGSALRPARFERRSIRPSVQETVIVDWEGAEDGPPKTFEFREPERARVDREPVDMDNVRDVIDPLSFMVQMLEEVERSNGDSCDFVAKTWDGARLAQLRTETDAVVQAARIDCRVVYERIDGLRRDTPWRPQEETTRRIVRFRKEAGVWRPKWLKIEGDFAGFRSTFTTTIRPRQG